MEKEGLLKSDSARQFPFFQKHWKKTGRKSVFFILNGIIAICLIFVGFIAFSPNKSIFKYSTPEIVYGEKVMAIHMMNNIPVPETLKQNINNASDYPSIQVSESYYDFGSVNSNQVLTRNFIIANNGTSSLIIEQAYTTCVCTIAELSAKEIPPGKAGLLTLQFDPSFHNMSGKTVRRGVIMYTNDPNRPIQEIWMQASIR